jgi:hypothetical protein
MSVETTIAEGKSVRQEAFTVVVNEHGGLIEINFPVHKGQKLLLTNPASLVQQSCSVVRVKNSQDGYFAVAFEFDCPAPQFWQIPFPPGEGR